MNGVIILDKPQDFTSFDAVAVMRGLAKERKIGHTGTLDPMATGVLPLLLGRAAKAADLLPDTEKEYRASFRLGEKRDTGDITGTVIRQEERPLSREALEEVLPFFRGEIFQVPPMYSAVSIGGKRLYELARKGLEVERPARKVTIHHLVLEEYHPNLGEGVLRVACSKGTYIRALIEDMAEKAGSCGTMTALRRTKACGFSQEEALSLETLRELGAKGQLSTVLRPVEELFQDYPAVRVSPAQAVRFQNGGGLSLRRLHVGDVTQDSCFRVLSPKGLFLGLARADLEKAELRFVKSFLEPGENL